MPNFHDQREVLKSVASTLKRSSVPFALAGGYAVWARGGPESTHDVDFVLPAESAEAALAALAASGHEEVPSSEDWLDKVGRAGVVVDLIYRLPIGDVDLDLLGRCDELSVDSVRMPVMSATDLVLSRLLALGVNACDFGPPLAFSRALREQIDWERIDKQVGDNPFAIAFLGLLESLDVIGGDRATYP